MGSVTGKGDTNRRDVINRSGLTSTTRISSIGPGSKGVGRVVAASNTDGRNAVAFASRSSVKPVGRSSSHNNVSKSVGAQVDEHPILLVHECQLQIQNALKLQLLKLLLLRKMNSVGY
jgi:hypothetical protein